MANYKLNFGDKDVQERLEKKSMPPKIANLHPNDKERAEMIQAIRESKK